MAGRGAARDASGMDPLIAAQAADGFYRQSQGFVQSIPVDSGVTSATISMGDLICSATCVALSIELFLKSLLILVGRPVPATHDLRDLYEAVPEGYKRAIRAFHRRQVTGRPGEAVSLRMVYGGDGSGPPQGPLPDQAEGDSVEAVLERNRDAFCSWRYLHEIALQQGPVVVDYEYRQLSKIAAAVSDTCHGLVHGT